MDINKVILAGRVVADPELKKTKGDKLSVTNIRVATNKLIKNKDGEYDQVPEFHTVVAFAKSAETLCNHLVKGQEIYCEGSLHTRSWESDGVTHYRTQINLDKFQLGKKPARINDADTVAEPAVIAEPAELTKETVEA